MDYSTGFKNAMAEGKYSVTDNMGTDKALKENYDRLLGFVKDLASTPYSESNKDTKYNNILYKAEALLIDIGVIKI